MKITSMLCLEVRRQNISGYCVVHHKWMQPLMKCCSKRPGNEDTTWRNYIKFRKRQINQENMKRNWKWKLIGGLSFTSSMYVFQSCCGTPLDFWLDILVEGQVKSKVTVLPIKGINVSVEENMPYDLTNVVGRFSFYTEPVINPKIKFEDFYGTFVNKETNPALTDKRRIWILHWTPMFGNSDIRHFVSGAGLNVGNKPDVLIIPIVMEMDCITG